MFGYIAVVIKVPGGAYRAFFPDLPGCRAEGRSVDGAVSRARAALRDHAAHLRGQGLALPAPRPATDVVAEETRYGAVAAACLELRDISLRVALNRRNAAAA